MFRKGSRSIIAKIVAVFSLLSIVFVTAVVIYQENEHYVKKIDTTKENVEILANVITNYIEVSLLFVDGYLKKFADYHAKNNSDTIHDLEMQKLYSQKLGGEIPYCSAIIVTNNQGIIKEVYSKTQDPNPFFNTGEPLKISHDLSYFLNNDEVKPTVSSFASEDGEKQFILISRKLCNNGLFNGMVTAVIDSNYLNTFFTSIDSSNSTEIILLSENNNILFKSRDIQKDINIIKFTQQPERLSKLNNLKPHQVLTEELPINNYLYVFSFKHFHFLPISVALITLEDNMLQHWITNMRSMLFLPFAIIIAGMTYFVAITIIKKIEYTEKIERLSIIARWNKVVFIAKAISQLKLPINAMRDFLDILQSEYFGPLTPGQNKRIEDVKICNKHITQVIDHLTRLFNHQQEVTTILEEAVGLDLLIDNVISILDRIAAFKEIQILYNTSLNTPPIIKVDTFKMEQIILTLVKILIDYSYTKSQIIITDHIDDNQALRVNFRSEGHPFAEENINKILSLFKYTDDINDIEENDIALLLAQSFIELHQGQIKFKSYNNINQIELILPTIRIAT